MSEAPTMITAGMGTLLINHGRLVNVAAMTLDDINLGAIAHNLSKQERASGNYERRYSVAEHAIMVSYLIEYYTQNFGGFTKEDTRRMALVGLHHDDSEGILIDLPRPVKYLSGMDGYREMEDKIQALAYEKFLDFKVDEIDYSWVKKADDESLRYEFHTYLKNAKYLLPWAASYDNDAVDYARERMEYWDIGVRLGLENSWEDVKSVFLSRHDELMDKNAYYSSLY